jgi:heme-degrading monooxygenase HmoA
MVARIWRTGVKPERFEEYERFERERSLPMFREQRGFVGVLFMREKADRAAVLTLWEDEKAVGELEASPLTARPSRRSSAAISSRGSSRWSSSRCMGVRSWRANSQRDSDDRTLAPHRVEAAP